MAEKFANMRGSPSERDLSTKRVTFLREKIEAGLALPFSWARATIDGSEEQYRVNGQHSSKMLVSLNGSFPSGLKVHLDDYVVRSKSDLALLFRQVDARQSQRSAKDVSGAYQGLHEDLAGIHKPLAKMAVDGAAWYIKNVLGLPVGYGDDVYRLFNKDEVRDFTHHVSDIFGTKADEMMRTPIIAAIYGTFDLCGANSKPYWIEVAAGGPEFDIDDTSPSGRLSDWLRTDAEQSTRVIKPGEYYQGAIFAWNAHREGKKIKKIKFNATRGFHTIRT
jgi:hypothetical protein